MALGKLTIVIGAGIIGSILTKDGNLSDITHLFSGAFKIVTKHLQLDKENPRSTSKPQTDSLLAQVNSLRQELQLLASSRSVTIVTGAGSGSGKHGVITIIVVGTVGFIIWWKGWKLSNMMFVTRRGFSNACTQVGKQLDQVSSSIRAAKQHISSSIDRVDSNLDECKDIAAATKCEVSQLHGDLNLFHTDVESVHRAVQTLESKIGRIEGSQNFTSRGIYHLCQFVENLESSRNTAPIQDSPSGSQQVIEFPQALPVVSRMGSLRLPAEASSSSTLPSVSLESPRVLHRSSTSISASGLKELQGISTAIKVGSSKSTLKSANTSEVSNGTTKDRNSSVPGSSWYAWKLPSVGLLSRTRSTAI